MALLAVFSLLLAVVLRPCAAMACACGCGVFEVGDLSMFPEGTGGMVFLNYDFQNQTQNWAGTSRAPAANNEDKKLETSFITLGLQKFFNRSWGVRIELPFAYRTFETESEETGNVAGLNWGAVGDLRIKGIYAGFLPDQSIGVSVGLKLPTGNYKHNDAEGDIDRDSEIGTGSTDLLLGGFIHHKLTKDDSWSWFAETEMDLPMYCKDGYCPGLEINAAAGIYYNGWSIGKVQIKPIAQVINSFRTSDSGMNAAYPVASGYERVFLSPGVEIDMHQVSVNASVDLPVYQRTTGNQLVAPVLVKVTVSYMF